MINEMRGNIDGYLDEAKREKRSTEMGSYNDEDRKQDRPSSILKSPVRSIYETSPSKKPYDVAN